MAITQSVTQSENQLIFSISIEKTKIEGIINDILDTILVTLEATKFQLEFYTKTPIDKDIKSIKELLSEKYLCPKFESEKQDAINWEKYDLIMLKNIIFGYILQTILQNI